MDELSDWIDIEAEGLSKRTVALYRNVLNRMVEFARKHNRLYLDELTPGLLRAAVTDLKTHPGKYTNFKGGEAMQITLVGAARSLCRHMLADGVAMPDLSVVKAPKAPERVQPRLTREDSWHSRRPSVTARSVHVRSTCW